MTDGIISPEAALAAAGVTTTRPATLADFLSLGHWRTRPIDPPESMLGEIITRTTRMFLGGPTGKGKTHLGLALAAGIASGHGFAHWRAARPARVLYLDGEMPRDLVQERLRDLTRRMPDARMDERLFALCAEDAEQLAQRWPDLGELQPLNTPAGRSFVLALVERLAPECIIFDNRMSLLTGDMKEELPWTETMPLVQELTRKRIAQVWIDHTGHDAGHIYGSKTKEWSFDVVALLKAVDNAAADVCFRLEFTKARRRKPSNRADFEPVLLTLADDAWTATPEGGANAGSRTARAGYRPALSTSARQAVRVLSDVIAEEGAPLPAGPDWPSAGDLRAVSVERWRSECKARGLSLAQKPDDQRRAIDRVMTSARTAGAVAVRDGLAWLPCERPAP